MATSFLAKNKAQKNANRTMYSGMRDKRILIYGDNSQGKTKQTTRIDPDHTLVLATEKGYTATALMYPPIDITSARDFKQVVRELTDVKNLEENLNDYHLIIIDAIDKLNYLFTTYVCKQNDVDKINQIPYGQGFVQVRTEIKDCINKLTQSGYGIIFIDHAETQDDYTDPVTGEQYPYTMPKATKSKSGEIFKDLADFAIFLQNNGSDEDGNVIPSTAIVSNRKNVFARSRFTKCESSFEFSAENLVNAVKNAVHEEAKLLGATCVDDFDESAIIKVRMTEEDQTKRHDALVKEIQEYGLALKADFADECREIMSEVGKLSNTKPSQNNLLERTLERLKDLADNNHIIVNNDNK
jgi:hypothetical protein